MTTQAWKHLAAAGTGVTIAVLAVALPVSWHPLLGVVLLVGFASYVAYEDTRKGRK